MSEFIDATTAKLDDELLAIARVRRWEKQRLDRQGGKSDRLYGLLQEIAESYMPMEREVRKELVEGLQEKRIETRSEVHKYKTLQRVKEAERTALRHTLQRLRSGRGISSSDQERYRQLLERRRLQSLQGRLTMKSDEAGRRTAHESHDFTKRLNRNSI